MRVNRNKWTTVLGWCSLLLAIGFFCLQIGYLFMHRFFQVEYIDHQLFFIINSLCFFFITLSLLLLLALTRRMIWMLSGAAILFLIVNGILLVESDRNVTNITSISPDRKHVFVVKENPAIGATVYYRSYYGIFCRPKKVLPQDLKGRYKVKWLANDIAALTYTDADDKIQQFIGTYGDRGGGRSYYYVGAEIHGQWQGGSALVISGTKGILVTEDGANELFEWNRIVQYGTLAVVLKRNDQAVWTLALNKDFEVHSDASEPTTGTIRLYRATMGNNQPVTLHLERLR
ncbi:hypothetical protein NIE88_06210 [Sporolactobacillus shoreicorticis]|uniref:Uncharacterized protein n=1 Tax=Sporolactobacillus shoreicorticis TaxID=1923877 RepID=A0ABW5S1W4_9BACL|nr:hypothetical protein [Sporolactobacillus shoreicorticis]MCO7125359.1 hypothetical protein [Sporolactobacillus shoreicorticis]